MRNVSVYMRKLVNHNVHNMQATQKFNEEYGGVLEEMINRLNLESNTVYPSFVAVCKEIFKDGINWGRIVALFAFGGRLAVYCAEHGEVNCWLENH